MVSAMNTTVAAVVITAPAIAIGCLASSSRLIPLSLLEIRHVRHERVDVGGGQRAVLVRHRRLLGGLDLGRHLSRMNDPLADLGSRQLLADAVERIVLVALAGDGMADLALLRPVDFF